MAKSKSSAKEQLLLEAKKRTVTGKKVKKLRKEGVIPANIFGTAFESLAIEVGVKDFIQAFKIAKETAIINIKVEKESYPTLIRDVQRHPVSRDILHIDFRKIDLSKKIRTEVPVVIIGTSPAVAHKGAILLTQLKELTIEVLPAEIPAAIEIDITSLKEIGDEIKVGSLKESKAYKVIDDADKTIVSVVEHKEQSVTPETTVAAAPEVITEKAPAEGEATVASAADKKPAETEKK